MKEWQSYRIKDVAQLISTKSENLSLPYIALDNILSWDAIFVPSDSSSDGNSNLCNAGDVLFGKLRPYLAKAFIPTEESICSPELLVLRPNKKIYNRFLLYFLLSKSFISNIRNQVAGVKMPRTNWAQIGNYTIFIPPIEEQEAIAAYLDMESGKILREIGLLEQEQKAYESLKRSLISEVVTRGLNKEVPLKDSGIDWIGEIPVHWEVIEIKTYCKNIFAGATPSTKEISYWDGDIPWIPSGSCHDSLITTYTDTITEEGLMNSSTKLIKANTTVMAMTGATCGNTGFLTFESCANQSVCAYIENPKLCFSKFLFYLLQAARKYILTFQTGGAQAGINIQDCSNLKVPFVPMDEQEAIAEYLDKKSAEIDKNISLIGKKIETYKRLKQSLIDEVVTGKRKI